MFELLVQSRLSDFAFVNIDDEAVAGPNEADVQTLLELVPLAADHDAVPVAIRLRARHGCGDQVWGETADALKQITNLLVFEAELRFVGQVLVLAASTFAKITALRPDTSGGRAHDANQSGASKSLFDFDYLRFDDFTEGDEWDKDNKIIKAGDAFAAEGDILNGQGDFIIWRETHCAQGRGTNRARKDQTKRAQLGEAKDRALVWFRPGKVSIAWSR